MVASTAMARAKRRGCANSVMLVTYRRSRARKIVGTCERPQRLVPRQCRRRAGRPAGHRSTRQGAAVIVTARRCSREPGALGRTSSLLALAM